MTFGNSRNSILDSVAQYIYNKAISQRIVVDIDNPDFVNFLTLRFHGNDVHVDDMLRPLIFSEYANNKREVYGDVLRYLIMYSASSESRSTRTMDTFNFF